MGAEFLELHYKVKTIGKSEQLNHEHLSRVQKAVKEQVVTRR